MLAPTQSGRDAGIVSCGDDADPMASATATAQSFMGDRISWRQLSTIILFEMDTQRFL